MKLIELATGKEFRIMSTMGETHKDIHKDTWRCPDGQYINHILVNNIFTNNDVRVYRGWLWPLPGSWEAKYLIEGEIMKKKDNRMVKKEWRDMQRFSNRNEKTNTTNKYKWHPHHWKSVEKGTKHYYEDIVHYYEEV